MLERANAGMPYRNHKKCIKTKHNIKKIQQQFYERTIYQMSCFIRRILCKFNKSLVVNQGRSTALWFCFVITSNRLYVKAIFLSGGRLAISDVLYYVAIFYVLCKIVYNMF